MIGSVPFSFSGRDEPKKAFDRFKEGTYFRIQELDFETKFKAVSISMSFKIAV